MGDSSGVSASVPTASAPSAHEDPGMIPVPASLAASAHVRGLAEYEAMHAQSLSDPAGFWGPLAREHLTWFRPFDAVLTGSFRSGDASWFVHGELNACVNCVDRHVAAGRGDEPALVWEADEPGEGRTYSFRELLAETCRVANVLRAWGVRRGDTVALYMPMIPETVFSMLACARLGAVHSVVFAGFSAEALRTRIEDAQCQWVLTSDRGCRGGRMMLLKRTVDAAVDGLRCVRHVFVFERRTAASPPSPGSPPPADVPLVPTRDVWMPHELPKHRGFCPAARMDAEDLLFLLYTSGSTGTPKGVAHATAGYLLYALLTTRLTFDVRPGDVFGCVADVGWVTGHSYVLYGPLLNGAATVLFESTPTYPHAGRYWELVDQHKLTQLYTAPTAIRALMALDHDHSHSHDRDRSGEGLGHAAGPHRYDLSSLRVLGSVGEPINREAWTWYFQAVGRGRCYVADTYWQTETGGHVGVGLPGATPMKPGACAKPFLGVDFVVTDERGRELTGDDVEGHLCIRSPWPGLARTVYGDHARFVDTYFPEAYQGLYFTGDGCRRDKDGFYFITGRVNDVLCTSGHRIGTAELEQALTAHEDAAEAAVIGIPHRIKGEGICCFVTLADGAERSAALEKQLVLNVREQIGAFATPDVLVIAPDLPKTRSGKIMRRVLRKIATGEEEQLGDLSTLADAAVVPALLAAVRTAMAGKKL